WGPWRDRRRGRGEPEEDGAAGAKRGVDRVLRSPCARRPAPLHSVGALQPASRAEPPVDDDLGPLDAGERLLDVSVERRLVALDDDQPAALVLTDLVKEGHPGSGRRGFLPGAR